MVTIPSEKLSFSEKLGFFVEKLASSENLSFSNRKTGFISKTKFFYRKTGFISEKPSFSDFGDFRLPYPVCQIYAHLIDPRGPE